jgi:IS30 family transposase
VAQGLKAGLSPELIAGRLPLDHPGVRISYEAIYQYIYAEHRELIRYLVRHNRKRRRRGHSRKHRQSHIPNRVAIAAVRQAISGILGAYPVDLRHTITYDNGHENVEHEWINQKLGALSFFCNPYYSWEKGTVENMIGLIRRYLPKRTNFSKITEDRIAEIEDKLNSRPRKCLAYRTSYEEFRRLRNVALAG